MLLSATPSVKKLVVICMLSCSSHSSHLLHQALDLKNAAWTTSRSVLVLEQCPKTIMRVQAALRQTLCQNCSSLYSGDRLCLQDQAYKTLLADSLCWLCVLYTCCRTVKSFHSSCVVSHYPTIHCLRHRSNHSLGTCHPLAFLNVQWLNTSLVPFVWEGYELLL